jgi:hypothetical protein
MMKRYPDILVLLLLLLAAVMISACRGENTTAIASVTSEPEPTGISSPPASALVTTAPATEPELIPIGVSVKGPLPPINPGGPIVEITLTNMTGSDLVALTATLELNRSFVFDFQLSPDKPLKSSTSVSQKMTLINSGFSTDSTYPLKISGVYRDQTTINYTTQVQIAHP